MSENDDEDGRCKERLTLIAAIQETKQGSAYTPEQRKKKKKKKQEEAFETNTDTTGNPLHACWVHSTLGGAEEPHKETCTRTLERRAGR